MHISLFEILIFFHEDIFSCMYFRNQQSTCMQTRFTVFKNSYFLKTFLIMFNSIDKSRTKFYSNDK